MFSIFNLFKEVETIKEPIYKKESSYMNIEGFFIEKLNDKSSEILEEFFSCILNDNVLFMNYNLLNYEQKIHYEKEFDNSKFIEFLFDEEKINSLTSKYSIFNEKALSNPKWKSIIEYYENKYNKFNEKNSINSISKFTKESFFTLSLFFDILFFLIIKYINEELKIKMYIDTDNSKIDTMFEHKGKIFLGNKTHYHFKIVREENVHSNNVLKVLNLFSKNKFEFDIYTIELILDKISSFLINNLIEDKFINNQSLSEIFKDESNPLFFYLKLLMKDFFSLEENFEQMNECIIFDEHKKILGLFNKQKKVSLLLHEYIDKHIQETINKDDYKLFYPSLISLLNIVHMTIRLDKQYGYYLLNNLNKDISHIDETFSKNTFSNEEKESIIQQLNFKYESLFSIIKVFIHDENKDIQVIDDKENLLLDLKKTLNLF